jgi:hypothetical protein
VCGPTVGGGVEAAAVLVATANTVNVVVAVEPVLQMSFTSAIPGCAVIGTVTVPISSDACGWSVSVVNAVELTVAELVFSPQLAVMVVAAPALTVPGLT